MPILAGNEGVEVISALFQPEACGSGHTGLHLACVASRSAAKLKRGEAVPMPRKINRRRVSIQALPDHQDSFAMIVAFVAHKGDVGGDGNISRELLPDKLEIVHPEPHVLAAAGYRIGAAGG